MPKFRKGESGNPRGRPAGLVDRRTKWRELLAPELPEIMATLVRAAKAGDVQAAGLILSRIAPPLRATGEAVRFALPEGASLTDCGRAVLAAAAGGQIAPDVARELLGALGGLARVSEIDELARRVRALEAGGSSDEP